MRLIRIGDKMINMDLVAYISTQPTGTYVAFAATHGDNVLSLRFEGAEEAQLKRWLDRHTESVLREGNGFETED